MWGCVVIIVGVPTTGVVLLWLVAIHLLLLCVARRATNFVQNGIEFTEENSLVVGGPHAVLMVAAATLVTFHILNIIAFGWPWMMTGWMELAVSADNRYCLPLD